MNTRIIIALMAVMLSLDMAAQNHAIKFTGGKTQTQSSGQTSAGTTPTKTQSQSAQSRPAQSQSTQSQSTQSQQRRQTTQTSTAQSNTRTTSSATTSSTASSGGSVLSRLSADMVYISGGTFSMGATAEQSDGAETDEMPAHQVRVNSFSLCKHEVTQEEWQYVMGSNPSKSVGSRKPVEMVSWNECQEFISKLNSLTGKNYRLPTEAEWEYAARGGSRSSGYRFSGSNSIGSVAWYEGNSGEHTHDVMTKSPNELGLYDMSGNVREWCSDRYSDQYYDNSPSSNPQGPSSGDRRVNRGGAWISVAEGCRLSDRYNNTANYQFGGLGLRLAQ